MSDALSFYYLFRPLEQVAGRVKEDRATRNSASIQIAYAENFSCLLRLGYGRTHCEGGNESNNPSHRFRFWILGFGLFTERDFDWIIFWTAFPGNPESKIANPEFIL